MAFLEKRLISLPSTKLNTVKQVFFFTIEFQSLIANVCEVSVGGKEYVVFLKIF